VSLPEPHPLAQQLKASTAETLNKESTREVLKEYDQLLRERKKGSAFIGLKDGEFWKFQCSYKYQLGAVDKYRYLMPNYHLQQCSLPFLSSKRTPSWTDRILYSTYTDSPDKPDESNITNLLYTSIPSYTTSDHVRIPSPRKRLLLTDFLLETNCMSPSASLPSTIIEGFSTSPSTSCQLQSSPRSLCYP
jgi:hypothetical protein